MISALREWAGSIYRGGRRGYETAVLISVALYVEAVIRTVNISRLAAQLGVPIAEVGATSGSTDREPPPLPRWADRRLRTVHSVMKMWPFAADRKCLRESLLLGFALRRLSPRLQIGVRASSDELLAHAWVDCGGHVLDPMAVHYTPLTGQSESR